ncbi:twin-arginine translocase TatA/TatE family subunit [Nocardiopsis potens]|uniref:twin-arginine translocase TatA/TatE family subunit n=1 Tax=Nocardiopsis potens TaxID=1246458 RepID=UPI000347E4EB|nr:twin-arginine translocase TatA/TatE family subunit [Nocardiopsis potens]
MGIGGRELLLLLLIALLVFGASRLPALARSLGRSARILKAEAKGLADENDAPEEDGAAAAQQRSQAAAPQALPPGGAREETAGHGGRTSHGQG